jgi:uncharacterized Fe-S cluster protein YjdI
MEKNDNKFTGGKKYKNNDITVFWKPSACVHASYCYRELIEVFDPSRRPWIDLNGSATDKIIEVVNLCPTEALSWKWNDETKNEEVGRDQVNHIKFKRPELVDIKEVEEQAEPVSIKIMTDGPIVLKGNFKIAYSDINKDVQEGIISICRCGESDHQPFCDGRHRKVGFNG